MASSTFFDDENLKLLRQDGTLVPVAEALGGVAYVLVYFSAQWCPPCHGTTPLVRELFRAHHKAKSFAVVLVSLDNTEEDAKECFAQRHGDYYCVPFAAAKPLAMRWSALYGFANLPTLLVLTNTEPRRLVTKHGCVRLRKDPNAIEFPWKSEAAAKPSAHL